ncbi:MAG: thiamine-phosphate kinase [Candidatus Methylacidiphilales bacterium]|nr:thiamine-phosphate kinase [Candidatus Methylacidiphilales bacterium]
MNEDARVARWIRGWEKSPGILLGPGDDCALVAPPPRGHVAVLKTDAVHEGVHFTRRDPARLVGRKALARAVSDFAACGATPVACLLALGTPGTPGTDAYTDGVMQGLAAAARAWKIGLAGGETTRTARLGLTVSLYGWVRRGSDVRRSDASPGDSLFVTGLLGGTRRGHHLRFTPRLDEGRWLAAEGLPSAMMDLSDGLGKDLPRLARASGVSYLIRPECLPRRRGCTPHQAVNDGEDHELLFTVPFKHCRLLLESWPFPTRLTWIGGILPEKYPPMTYGLKMRGYDPFASQP